MAHRPTLETPRLILRPFTLGDAPDVQRLAGAREVAATTLNIPHPYEDGVAEAWISTHQAAFDASRLVTLAVTLREGGALIGGMGLRLEPDSARAEMGYWTPCPTGTRATAPRRRARCCVTGSRSAACTASAPRTWAVTRHRGG